MRAWFLAAISVGLLSEPAQAVETSAVFFPRCFDVAVIARLDRQEALPFTRDPNALLQEGPWRMTFTIEQRLAGKESRPQVVVTPIMHVGFNRQIRHFLLFLAHKAGGSYDLAGLEHRLVRDDQGNFVIPFTEPLSADSLESGSFFPANYQQLLRPIPYRVEDAWWLSASLLDPDGNTPILATDYPWGRVEKSGVVAERSLRVSDLIDAVADRRCHLSRKP